MVCIVCVIVVGIVVAALLGRCTLDHLRKALRSKCRSCSLRDQLRCAMWMARRTIESARARRIREH